MYVNSKMQPLIKIKELFIFAGVCQSPETTPWHIKLRNKTICVSIIFSLISGSVQSGLYIQKYIMTDLESALFAIFQVFGEFCVVYVMVTSIICSKEMKNIFEEFAHMHETGMK